MNKYKNIWQKLISIIITAAAIYYIAVNVDFNDVLNRIKQANMLFVSVALILLPVNLYLQYLKWKLSCNFYLPQAENKKLLPSLFIGFSAAVFTPARTGEYVGRGIPFKDKKFTDIASAVFFDKFFNLVFVFIFGLAASLIFAFYTGNNSYFYAAITGSAVISALIFFTVVWKKNRFYEYIRLKSVQWLRNKFSFLRIPDKKISVKMTILSFFFYACYIFQFAVLISAFTNDYNIILYVVLAGLIMFVKTLIPNVISGELGIRESASVFFLFAAGKNPAAGFSASLFLFILNIALPAAIGIFFLFRNKYE